MLVRRNHRRLFFALVAALFIACCLFSWSPFSTLGGRSESVQLERFMNGALSSTKPIELTTSSFDWSSVPFEYLPPASLRTLPKGRARRLPQVQYAFGHEAPVAAALRTARRDDVRRVFQQDWQNYRELAWMHDSFAPISGHGKSQFSGWSATLVDSLDTLWMMGLREEFDEAVAAVAGIDFGVSTSKRVSVFETTIRYLGGLLAAYDLSRRDVLLIKAVELGDLIYAAFNTRHQMPVDFIRFQDAKTGKHLNLEPQVVAASPGSLCLELTHLAQVTGNQKYYDAADRVMRMFAEHQQTTKLPGLWPKLVSMMSPDVQSRNEFTLGGGADSLFEYVPKMHALLGGLEPMYENMTTSYVDAATEHLFFRPMLPDGADILISGNVAVDNDGGTPLDPESEHLACFVGGNVALAGRLLDRPDYVETGAKLAKGCAYVYQAFPSGLMPERFNVVPCRPKRADTCPWDEDLWVEERGKRREWRRHLPKGFTTAKDPRYLLRPEAIESIFYMYRITGDTQYQDIAWDMFQATVNASATTYGHASVRDVTLILPDEEARQDNLEDYMEVSSSLEEREPS